MIYETINILKIALWYTYTLVCNEERITCLHLGVCGLKRIYILKCPRLYHSLKLLSAVSAPSFLNGPAAVSIDLTIDSLLHVTKRLHYCISTETQSIDVTTKFWLHISLVIRLVYWCAESTPNLLRFGELLSSSWCSQILTLASVFVEF